MCGTFKPESSLAIQNGFQRHPEILPSEKCVNM